MLSDLINPVGEYNGVGNEQVVAVREAIAVYADEYGSKRYVFYAEGKAVSGIQVVVGADKAIIANIFTHPDFRRQGHCKKLYYCIKNDYPYVSFGTDRSELGAIFVDSVSR